MKWVSTNYLLKWHFNNACMVTSSPEVLCVVLALYSNVIAILELVIKISNWSSSLTITSIAGYKNILPILSRLPVKNIPPFCHMNSCILALNTWHSSLLRCAHRISWTEN